MRGAVGFGAVERRGLEAQIAGPLYALQDYIAFPAHRRDDPIDAIQLDIEHRAHQFAGARAIAGKRLVVVVPPGPERVTGIDGAIDARGNGVVVCGDAAAFASGHVLVEIEAEGADVADGAELASFIAAAHALAGIFDDQELAASRNRHDRIHVAGGAPHMHRNDGARPGTDSIFDGGGIDGDGFIHIHDHRESRRQPAPRWLTPYKYAPAPALHRRARSPARSWRR